MFGVYICGCMHIHIGPFSHCYISTYTYMPICVVSPQYPLYCLHIQYQTYSIVLTVPLKVITVPPSGETVKVAVGAKYWISCNVTGDEAPTDNPWLHSDKTKVENDTKGVTVTTVSLQDTIGIKSTITFTKVTKDQLGDYICSAGDGKPNVTVTLKEAGKRNMYLSVLCLHDAGDVGYRVFLGRCKIPQAQVCYFMEEFCN